MKNTPPQYFDRMPLGPRLILDQKTCSLDYEKISYPDEGNEACFAVEDESFWFRHRNACLVEMVRNFTPEGKGREKVESENAEKSEMLKC